MFGTIKYLSYRTGSTERHSRFISPMMTINGHVLRRGV
jgi:hypothetical protein